MYIYIFNCIHRIVVLSLFSAFPSYNLVVMILDVGVKLLMVLGRSLNFSGSLAFRSPGLLNSQ